MQKVIRTIILIIFLIVFSLSAVYAESEQYSCVVRMAQNKTDIKSGETVIITLKITNIDVEDGINAFDGVIKYDENIFNVSLEKTENWSTPEEISGGHITVSTLGQEYVKTNQEVVKILLTAKENAIPGTYNVEIDNASIGAIDSDFEVSVEPISITIVNEDNEAGITQDDEENEDKNGEKQNDGSTESIQNGDGTDKNIETVEEKEHNDENVNGIKQDNTTAKDSLPKAGLEKILPIAVETAIVFAIISYVGYKRTY